MSCPWIRRIDFVEFVWTILDVMVRLLGIPSSFEFKFRKRETAAGGGYAVDVDWGREYTIGSRPHEVKNQERSNKEQN